MGETKFTNPNLNETGSIYGAWQTETGDYMISAKVYAARAPLADFARPLCLHRPQA